MIRLGLRLTLGGGKEAAVRLAVTTAAVALGVGLLLAALAGMNAINAQNARIAWLNTGSFAGNRPGLRTTPPADETRSTGDPLWWLFSTDYFGSQTIDRVDLAATGPHSPVPPGIAHLPGPGQFYASPALSHLLHTTPAGQLADRFPGQQVGTIGPAALPAPNSLIIVIGRTARQLSQLPGAAQVASINADASLAGAAGGFNTNRLQTILAVGALALLFPVLIFIGTAARLAGARREQRFAAMRLVGATPRQVTVISTVEASVAAIGGVAIGFAVFFGLRPALTQVAFTGQRFAPGDLSLGLVDIVLVAVGVPLAAAVSARLAMRRVQISPLGVSRRVTPPGPRAYRLLPLLAGVAELAYFVEVGHPASTGDQIWAYLSGCLLIMAGLVTAGPWLTMVGSRFLAGRATRPASLLAGRRLADNPQAAFRTISGLIVALFATSVSVGVITTMLAYGGTSSSGTAASGTLLDQCGSFAGPHLAAKGQPVTSTPALPAALLGELRSTPGVHGVTVIHSDPDANQDSSGGLALCSELARTPAMGACTAGATVASLAGDLNVNPYDITRKSTLTGHIWPSAPITAAQLSRLAVRAVVVQTSGATAALEAARTDLEVAFPTQPLTPSTFSEINAASMRTITELQQMTNVVIVVSLIIAGCSLAVSVTAGISDRKRPFSLLRLAGVPVRVLRHVVAIEAVVPLLLSSVLSAGLGFLAAGLFLNSQLDETLRPPHPAYYLIVLAGLLTSLTLIAATLPLIERITGPEVARNE